ncbi:hypothetical protein ACFYL6_19285 [Micromonospora sp. NPDC007208]
MRAPRLGGPSASSPLAAQGITTHAAALPAISTVLALDPLA